MLSVDIKSKRYVSDWLDFVFTFEKEQGLESGEIEWVWDEQEKERSSFCKVFWPENFGEKLFDENFEDENLESWSEKAWEGFCVELLVF